MIEKPLFSVFGVGKMIYPRIKKRYERKINQNDSFAKGETIFAGNKMKIKNQTRYWCSMPCPMLMDQYT